MTLLTTAYLLEKYGPLLTEDNVAEVLHIGARTVRNQRSLKTFPIPCSKQGGQPLWHASDVAEHVDGLRKGARA